MFYDPNYTNDTAALACTLYIQRVCLSMLEQLRIIPDGPMNDCIDSHLQEILEASSFIFASLKDIPLDDMNEIRFGKLGRILRHFDPLLIDHAEFTMWGIDDFYNDEM
jgi:hypothetical protein